MLARLLTGAEAAPTAELVRVVHAVHSIPYGRPSTRSVRGVLEAWRGTCSGKHALLHALLVAHWPTTVPRVIHRIYRVDRADAELRHGPRVADTVPPEGLIDVHRFLLLVVRGRAVSIDVTFEGSPRWDGVTSMQVVSGPGRDVVAGHDADADKRRLETLYCDPSVREPFIAALGAASQDR